MSALPRPVPGPRLIELTPGERRIIVYLRLWSAGPRGQADVWQDIVARLGGAAAVAALGRFEALLLATARLAQRPPARHGLDAPAAGDDERAFARLLLAAAAGRRGEVRRPAAGIAGPAGAEALARAAEQAAPAIAGTDPPRRCACRGRVS